MKLSTLKLTLVIAALMLVLAGIVSVIGGGPSAGGPTLPSDQISTTPDAAATPTNAPVTPPVTLTIKPPAHTPTPTLKPTPTPTPKPTPVPTPASRSLGSGSFRSDTGVPINLVCSWSAETNGSSTAVITVTAALESYALHVNASAKALRFTVNGSSTAADVAAINTDTTEPLLTELGKQSFTVNIADGETVTVPVSVEWLFGGVYSSVQLDVVTAAEEITLSR